MDIACRARQLHIDHADPHPFVPGKESSRAYISGATSALLTAASRVLHFVMPKMEPKERTDGIVALFTTAFEYAMCAFSDSLPDRLLLCACLGGLVAEAGVQKKGQPACRQTLIVQRLRGSLDLIFTTLEQAMQVWSCTSMLHTPQNGILSLELCIMKK